MAAVPQVENYFLNVRRYILPGCHAGYWYGMRADTGAWGKWKQLDKTITNNTYTHWGIMNMTVSGGNLALLPEPNGKAKAELCVLANHSQTYSGSFGWADANCNTKQIFMCRIMGEWWCCQLMIFAPGAAQAGAGDRVKCAAWRRILVPGPICSAFC